MKFMIVAALSLAPLAPAQDCPNVSSSLIEDAPIYDISGSSLLTVLARANALLVRQPKDPARPAGDTVQYIPI